MRSKLAIAVVLIVAVATATAAAAESPSAGSAGANEGGGIVTLAGAKAAAFEVPHDVRKVWTARLANGVQQTRYQQFVADASVLGGQLTVLRDLDGSTLAVIGAHYPGLAATNSAKLSPQQARGIAEQRIGAGGVWLVRLRIDPADGRLFYETETRRFDERWIHWIDAANGAVRNAFDAIAHGTGTGVKGDEKSIETTFNAPNFEMINTVGEESRQETYDAQNRRNGPGVLPGRLFTDANDVWDLAGTASPGHPAGVDAHYYAKVTDDFYAATFGRDSLDDDGMTMISTVHFGRRYNNAFWNGTQMVYGDGDGTAFIEFSGALDVVAHELTHGVTQFTSNLIYQDESGALNESFSDILGNTVEFYADGLELDPTVEPDFLIGEDISLEPDDVDGLRNMGDPQEDEDPDHYSELVGGQQDNGGVHSNSGIPNHAYVLLVNGGSNAGCDSVGSDGHTHTANCDVNVSGVGLDDAAQIFYTGFTSLPENANMCSARLGTIAAATSLGSGASNTADAWTAVGVLDGCAPAPPPPVCGDEDAAIPFESDHPYSNNQDCTWTYDNGIPGFRLHFSLLHTEPGFDFVFVTDGAGEQLHAFDGNFPGGVTTDCITTSTVDVRLVSDPLITRPGFTVDAVLEC